MFRVSRDQRVVGYFKVSDRSIIRSSENVSLIDIVNFFDPISLSASTATMMIRAWDL